MIAINDVDMPRSCDDCMFCRYIGLDYYCCDLTTYSVNSEADERDSKCPLIDLTSLEQESNNGTTGTDHCEHDCVDGALHIIDKYQKIQEIVAKWEEEVHSGVSCSFDRMEDIKEVVEDGKRLRTVEVKKDDF